MEKFDTWSITCNFCNCTWETCSSVIAYHPKCLHCQSNEFNIQKNKFLTIKKKGKIIINIPVDTLKDISDDLDGFMMHKTTKT